MHELFGKWVQTEGQPYEGLWFEFNHDKTFKAEYEPMGIKSSGTFETDDDKIIIHQREHTLGLTGDFKGLFAIEADQLKMALSATPGGSMPKDLSEARVYIKEK